MEAAVASNKAEEFVEALLKTVTDPSSIETLKRLKELLSKSANLLGTRVSNLERDCIDLAVESSEVFHSTYPDVQFLEPRGRFTLKFSTNTIVIDGKGGNGSIPVNKVTHLCLLPSHTSSKKEGEDYLVVIFSEPIKICGKPMTSLLLNLSKTLPKLKPGEIPPQEGSDAAMTESRRIGLAFKNSTGVKVHLPNPRLFTSVVQQRAFLRCHKGVNEGAIYPISCGLIFIKPLIFIGTDEIASFTAGRGGGSGNTRFVDIQIETTKDVNYEFSNIDREELAALNTYVKGFLEARRKKMDEAVGASTTATSASAAVLQQLEQEGDDDDDDDSDDEDDEDYEEDGDSSSDDGQGNASDASDNDEDSDDSDFEEATSRNKKKSKKNNDSDDDSDEGQEKSASKKTKSTKKSIPVPLKKQPKVQKEKNVSNSSEKKVGKSKDAMISLVEEEIQAIKPVNLSKEVDLVSEGSVVVENEDLSGKKRSFQEQECASSGSASAAIIIDEALKAPSSTKKFKIEAVAAKPTIDVTVTNCHLTVEEARDTSVLSVSDISTVPSTTTVPPSLPKKNTLFAAWGQKPKPATTAAVTSSGANTMMDVDETPKVAISSQGGLEIIEV